MPAFLSHHFLQALKKRLTLCFIQDETLLKIVQPDKNDPGYVLMNPCRECRVKASTFFDTIPIL